MGKRLIIASAGAGKTNEIVSEAKNYINHGEKVLAITYTRSNQQELLSRFSPDGSGADKFIVKGLFTFLLEDIVRPYQHVFFADRIQSINFNDKGDPHKKNGRTIKGRKEIQNDGFVNPEYYLTSEGNKAHSTYLSKLASKIMKLKCDEIVERLERIYKHIYIDEVQDLVGWDYEVLRLIGKSNSLNITCVGDFRQTIYDTSIASKLPKSSSEKLEKFKSLNFSEKYISISRRSIQSICDFSDQVHNGEGYEKTVSTEVIVPSNFQHHLGIFAIRESDVERYIRTFHPVLLRRGANAGTKFDHICVDRVTFGKSKGLSFNRVLIVPTSAYREYLLKGNSVFSTNKTDEAKNKLYVAITRARYSVTFILPDSEIDLYPLEIWSPT